MEVMTIPSLSMDFNSACTSPYISAPSSPTSATAFFHSAPTSPTRAAAYLHFYGGDNSSVGYSPSSVPFHWEEKPGTPKTKQNQFNTTTSFNYEEQDLEQKDFAFDSSGQFERCSLSADELFDGGKIKPLKPPPGFQHSQNKPLDSPKSPKSPKKLFSGTFKKKDFDPFEAAMDKVNIQESENKNRGRERTSCRHKATRSLSPFRVSELLFEPSKNSPSKNSSSYFSSFLYKKWKIKDLLLFRSASESRATDKEEMEKHSHQDEVKKSSSFTCTDSDESSLMDRRRSGPLNISAHELHHSVKKAVFEEMKKRSFWPYKGGLLGCLGFHPTVPDINMPDQGSGSSGSSMSK